MKRLLILPVALFFVVSGCNKPLTTYNSVFEGTWYSAKAYNTTYGDYVCDQFTFSGKDGSYLIDCQDTCSTTLCGCVGSVSGVAEINRQHTMFRLDGVSSRTFVLNTEPYQDANGVWHMEVDSRDYTKQ